MHVQSQGIGRRLFEAAEKYATEELGAKKVIMHVIVVREDLLGWYNKMGYKGSGEILPFPTDANVGVPRKGWEQELKFERLEKQIA